LGSQWFNQVSSIVTMRLTNSSPIAGVSDFHLVLPINKPSFSGHEFGRGGPIVQIFTISIFMFTQNLNSTNWQPVLMATSSDIRSTLTQRFCITAFSIAWASWGSTWRLLLSRRNSAAQCATMEYDSTSSPYTEVFVCISPATERYSVSKTLSPDDSVFH